MKNEIPEFKRILLYIGVLGALAGNLGEIFFNQMPPYILLINAVNSTLAIVVLVVFLFRMVSADWANGLVVYLNLFNVVFSLFSQLHHPEIELLFFRLSMLLGLLILYAGFALGRNHTLIVGGIVLGCIVAIVLGTQSVFIKNSLPLLLTILFTFVFGINYILNMLDNYHQRQKELIEDLNQQNKRLSAQKNALNRLNDTKDKIFSVMAHDLKTPLNSIQGFSYLLYEGIKYSNKRENISYVQHINDASKKLNNLLDDLLAWGRLQTGNTPVKRELHNLVSLVQEAVELLNGNAVLKSIRLKVEVNDSIELMMDKNMILTVIRNLVSNAIKFSNMKSEILISSQVQNSRLYISVQDRGVGMDEHLVKELFSNFKVDSTLGTMNETGTGMGLIICQEYVQLHQGKIWAKSSPGKGTIITFTLPLQTATANTSNT